MKHRPFTPELGACVEPTDERGLMELDEGSVIELFKGHGLLHFRGFGADPEAFEEFSGRFSDDFMTYMGGGYFRRTINESGDRSIMSVNYYLGRPQQATFELPIHGEMYYLDQRPVVIWFYCVEPAVEGGETSVVDGAALYAELEESTKRLFAEKRLLYIRHYEEADWKKRFQTEDLDVVRAFCEEQGQRFRADEERGTVDTEYLHPATIESRWGGQTVFINNILPVIWQERHGRDTNLVRLEGGDPIPAEVIEEIEEGCRRLRKLVPWERGELVMLDNTRVLHGRQSFDDDVRQIYSRMVRSVSW